MMGLGSVRKRSVCVFWLIIASLIFVFSVPEAATYNINVDGSSNNGTVPHFWSECVGCGSMEMCMRKDVQEHFKMAAEELGMKRVRGHGFIEGWMGPSHGKMDIFRWNNGNPTYNWTSVDSVIGFLISIGMRPIIEVDFSPPGIRMNSSKSSCPPAADKLNYWRDLVYNIVKHCIDKWGVEEVRTWYWEVWNEPDNMDFFDVGVSKDQHSTSWQKFYYDVYDKAVEGALKADSQIIIGGPSTCTNGPLKGFVDHCQSKGTRVSFLTNHAYGAAPGNSVNPAGIRGDNRGRYTQIKRVGASCKSVNTEYNTTWAGQGGWCKDANCKSMDGHYNAVFIAKVTKLILDDHTSKTCPAPDILSYWVISDVFDEGWYIENYNKSHNANLPFGQVFGLINYQGIRKAAFNSFKVLNMMGDTRLSYTGGISNPESDGVDGFATINKDKNTLCVLVYNHYGTVTTTGNDEISLKIDKIPFANGHKIRLTHYRIDENNSNPYKVWQKNGEPDNPSAAVWNELRKAQHLVTLDSSEFNYEGAAYTKSFTLPREGMSMFVLKDLNNVTMVSHQKNTPVENAITVQGSKVFFNGPAHDHVRLTICGLDGKVLAVKNFAGKGFVDLGDSKLAGGFHIVRVETKGQCMVKKVLIQ